MCICEQGNAGEQGSSPNIHIDGMQWPGIDFGAGCITFVMWAKTSAVARCGTERLTEAVFILLFNEKARPLPQIQPFPLKPEDVQAAVCLSLGFHLFPPPTLVF